NVTTFCQRAGKIALESDHKFLVEWVKDFNERRQMMIEGLRAIPGVTIDPPPLGAFYAFPDVSGLYGKTIAGKVINGSLDFADVALEHAQVAVVPGIGFGEDRCVRLSYATDRATI